MLELQLSPFRELSTARLRMRQLREDDLDAMFGMRSDPRNCRFLDRDPDASIEQTRAVMQRMQNNFLQNEGMTWVITLKGGNDELLGLINFWNIRKEHYRSEVGYMLQAGEWNKGYMSEALEAALDFGFRELKFHSVDANVNPHNIASIRVLEKQGFVKEAHFREDFYYKGQFLDSLVYARLTQLR